MDLIDGVKVRPLKPIHDERGYLMEMLRSDWPEFMRFGRVYVTIGYPNIVKGWHFHKVQTDNSIVVRGQARYHWTVSLRPTANDRDGFQRSFERIFPVSTADRLGGGWRSISASWGSGQSMKLGGKRLSRAAPRSTIRRSTAVSKNSGLSSVARYSRRFELRRGITVPSRRDDIAAVHFFSRMPKQVPLWEQPDLETALFQSRFESSVPVVELQKN